MKVKFDPKEFMAEKKEIKYYCGNNGDGHRFRQTLISFPCLLRQSGYEGRTAKPKLARHPLGGLKGSVNPV